MAEGRSCIAISRGAALCCPNHLLFHSLLSHHSREFRKGGHRTATRGPRASGRACRRSRTDVAPQQLWAGALPLTNRALPGNGPAYTVGLHTFYLGTWEGTQGIKDSEEIGLHPLGGTRPGAGARQASLSLAEKGCSVRQLVGSPGPAGRRKVDLLPETVTVGRHLTGSSVRWPCHSAMEAAVSSSLP